MHFRMEQVITAQEMLFNIPQRKKNLTNLDCGVLVLSYLGSIH